MPGATRKNIDASTGHGCYIPRPNTPNGSPDVIINGQGAVRISDAWPVHVCPSIPDSHGATQSGGSSTVIVNGLGLARIGDSLSCGDASAAGSSDVIAG
jgi:uncharacterized Zn-binding protein involved in type VI secretion